MEQQGTICSATVRIIRERSEEGQPAQPEEIFAELIGQGLLELEDGDERFHLEIVLKEAVEQKEDIKEISGSNGIPCYYSTMSLTEAYVRILIQRKENPLSLMAEIVRENSSVYPRPVPLDIFKESPFDFTQDELLVCLKKMAEEREYQDIAQTITSIGTMFLYSTQYLEPDYASSLAEWLDVGQVNNP